MAAPSPQHQIRLLAQGFTGISRRGQQAHLGAHHQVIEIVANKTRGGWGHLKLLLEQAQLRLLIPHLGEAMGNPKILSTALNRSA